MSTKCESCGHAHENWITKDRLDTVAGQRREAVAKADDLAKQLAEAGQQLKAAQTQIDAGAGLQAEVERLQGLEGRWTAEKSIMLAGVESDGVDVVRMLWDNMAEDARPSGGLSAWLSDRDALPKAVSVYLGGDEAAPAAAPPSAKASEPEGSEGQPPAVNGTPAAAFANSSSGAHDPAGSSSLTSADAISSMSLDEYKERREALLASID